MSIQLKVGKSSQYDISKTKKFYNNPTTILKCSSGYKKYDVSNINDIDQNDLADASEIYFGNTITAFEDEALRSYTNLEYVTFPPTLSKINTGMFYNHKTIHTVNIQNGTRAIGDMAFINCSNLSSITIPLTLTELGNWAFSQCPSLYHDENGVCYDSQNKTILINVPNDITSYIIPNTVRIIQSDAFDRCDTLKTINIPTNLSQIDTFAFRYFSGLSSITIPPYITKIKESAFGSCENLENIILHNNIDTIEARAFSGCSKLTDITIPTSLTVLNAGLFNSCTSLTAIVIPNTIAEINDKVFANCSSCLRYDVTSYSTPPVLKLHSAFNEINSDAKIVVKTGTLDIWQNATEWTKLSDYMIEESSGEEEDPVVYTHTLLTYTDNSTQTIVANTDNALTKELIQNESNIGTYDNILCATIGQDVETISAQAFRGCRNLTSIIIPDNVKIIDQYAFGSCSKLSSITLSEGITDIGRFAFEMTALSSIVIPNNVTSVGIEAFSFCSNLETIVFSDNMTTIEDGVCAQCQKLSSVTLPTELTSIDVGAFQESGISSITLPETLTSIGAYAFFRSDLTSITIPRNVTTIEQAAFTNCASMQWVDFSTHDGPLDFGNQLAGGVFPYTNEPFTIYVKPNTLTAWTSHITWSVLYNYNPEMFVEKQN